MNRIESFEALRRANPRRGADFHEAVDAAAAEVSRRIATATTADAPQSRLRRPHRRLIGLTAGVALAAAAAVAVFLTVGSSGVTPGVEPAGAAAMKKAVKLSAASAERSGTVTVHMTQDGQVWAHKVVRWNGDDMEITDNSRGGPSSGLPLVVVNGMMYGHDPDHEGWVEVGPVSSIDPGSGTTPTDILAAVREDVGGKTLRRIVRAMTAGGVTTTRQSDGSAVYRGTVPAGQIARRTGFKEGETIRVFPFGYVAHDAAADPATRLDTAVTVGGDGVIREIAVTWGTWTYTVTYRQLGSTPPVVAPANAKTIREMRRLPQPG